MKYKVHSVSILKTAMLAMRWTARVRFDSPCCHWGQIGFGAYPASNPVDIRGATFPGVKLPNVEANHLPPWSTET